MRTKNRTGETNTNTAGYAMTILAYRNANDIDIRFDDGQVVTHKRYSHFKDGSVLHPDQDISDALVNHAKRRSDSYKNKYLGKQAAMNCGETCEIAEYVSSKDITVRFLRTGSVVKTALKNFRERSVQDPKSDNTQIRQNRDSRTGETRMASSGLALTVTEYRNNNDIDVTFEDGTKICHRPYTDFVHDRIPHPLYPVVVRSLYTHESRIGCVTRKQMAYNCGIPNYYCTCEACLHSDIWDWREIQDHNRIHEKD